MSNYSSGKKGKKRRVKKFRLDEISMVDKPQHGPARVAIMKRATEDSAEIQKNKLALTTLTAGHAHSVVLLAAGPEGMGELRAGQTSMADGHVHDWVMDDAGNIIIADADGHSHGISVLVTKAAEDITPGDVLAALGENDVASDGTAEHIGNDEGTTIMSESNENAADTQAVNAEQHAEIVAKAERLATIVDLPAEQRAHFDALPASEQDAFLAAEDKDALVKSATESDPVVFEDAEAGITLRKSADPTTLALAKQAKQAREELARERGLRKAEELLKRSGELLKNCAGAPDAKAALLGAIEGIADETLRKSAMEIVTAKDAGLQKAFEAVGTADDGGAEVDVSAQLDTLAKRHRETNPNLTPEQAYVAVLETPEGRELQGQL